MGGLDWGTPLLESAVTERFALPPSLKEKRYYLPSDQGQEAKIRENHEKREILRDGGQITPEPEKTKQ